MKKINILIIFIITILITGCSFTKEEKETKSKPYIYIAEEATISENIFEKEVKTYNNLEDAYKANAQVFALAVIQDENQVITERYVVFKYKNKNYYLIGGKNHDDEFNKKAYTENKKILFDIFGEDICYEYPSGDEVTCHVPYEDKSHLSIMIWDSGDITAWNDDYEIEYDPFLEDRVMVFIREKS